MDLLSVPSIYIGNITGVLLGCYYLSIFSMYCPIEAKIKYHYALLLFGTMCVISIYLVLENDKAAYALGWAGCVICVLMFTGPLVVIQHVLKSRSTAAMPFGFTFAGFLNCFLWTIYGYMILLDPFVWIPNGLGLIATIVQLSLFLQFPNN